MSPIPPYRPPSRAKEKDFQTPRVVFQPRVADGLQAGFDKLVELIRPTLGPLPHVVAHQKIGNPNQLPEMLDSGGTIARRVIEIPNRDEDVGFMYLRHMLWKLQESEGDGTATAAVLFDTIYRLGHRYVVAGGNAMGLRQHFERGMRLILSELDRQTIQIHGKQKLAGLARAICYDDELAKMLGEIFDVIGAYGRLEVRKGSGRELIREYVEGMYWDSGLRSREMANAEFGLRANLENAQILITDLDIEEPEQLVPLLTLAVKNNIKQLVLVSASLSDKAMSILLAKPNRERVFVVAVKTPGFSAPIQRAALEDLAILTGGKAMLRVTGATIEQVKLEDLGRARRIWADSEYFGIIGGKGDPRALREHIARLRQAFKNTSVGSLTPTDANSSEDRKVLLERLGKLLGGSGTLFIGALSPTALEARVELAIRTADAMRGAMRDGVVPGGGVALLNCREAMKACLANAQDSDERAAYNILLQALETPFRVIVENTGFWPGNILAEADFAGPGYGFDATARKVVNMAEAGILDTSPVVKAAVRGAVSAAALALTTDVVIHRKNPPEGIHT